MDEVLAVGDADFQSKCIGKMQDVATDGRTVLFVSHNMPAVRKLTNVGVYLKSGRVEAFGKTSDVIEKYLDYDQLRSRSGELDFNAFRREKLPKNADVQIVKISCEHSERNEIELPILQANSPLNICIMLEASREVMVCVSMSLVRNQEQLIATLFSLDSGSLIRLNVGANRIVCARCKHAVVSRGL